MKGHLATRVNHVGDAADELSVLEKVGVEGQRV